MHKRFKGRQGVSWGGPPPYIRCSILEAQKKRALAIAREMSRFEAAARRAGVDQMLLGFGEE